MSKIRAWLQAVLGIYYTPIVDTIDRAATQFLLVMLGKMIADGFDVKNIVHLSYWQAAAIAGGLAAFSVIKSAIMTLVTGQPALLGLFNRDLRARRDIPPIKHKVPVKRPARKRTPSHKPKNTKPEPYRPEHEAAAREDTPT